MNSEQLTNNSQPFKKNLNKQKGKLDKPIPDYNPTVMFDILQAETNERKKVEMENELMRSHIELLTDENNKLQDQIKELRSYNNKLLFRKT